jgi:hypothetical protein
MSRRMQCAARGICGGSDLTRFDSCRYVAPESIPPANTDSRFDCEIRLSADSPTGAAESSGPRASSIESAAFLSIRPCSRAVASGRSKPKQGFLRRFFADPSMIAIPSRRLRAHSTIRPGVDGPGGNSRISCLRNDLHGKRNQSKKILENKHLHGSFDHGCVLFVQHPFKNGLMRPVLCGSFVACAETFGNCDLATEGGIPRSSRFRWFA